MKTIFIPCIDNGMGLSRTSWAMSLAAACLTVLRDYDVTLRSISYPYPDGAMNVASEEFLRSGCEEMILIDTDIVFSMQHLTWLMSHDEPLVFGAYPKKLPGLEFPMELLGEENPFVNPHEENPLVEVKRTARGFMRCHKSVLARMCGTVPIVPFFIGEGRMWEFWKQLPGGHSDDFNFCDRWRELGGKILVDKRITTQHEGSAVYPIPGTF